MKVLVLREVWYNPSETFIARQLLAYKSTEAQLVAMWSTGRIHPALHAAYLGDGTLYVRVLSRVAARFGIAWGLRRAVRKYRPDIVHVHFATDAVRFRNTLKRLQVPYVVTLH